MTRRARGLLAAALLLPGLAVPASAGAAASACAATGPRVCIDLSHTPDAVSAAAPGSTTYAALTTVVRNAGTNTATHVTLTDRLPAGTGLVSFRIDRGSCAPAADGLTCDIGRLDAGAAATLSVNVTAPASAGRVTHAATARFDERASDNPASDPKQDSVAAEDPIDVVVQEGRVESWVPAATTADLSTDPSGTGVATPRQSQIATVHVPAQATGRVALLARTAGPFACPPKQVCRKGDWMQASIPGTFLDPPLQFGLRWDASLVDAKQTDRNLAVYYTECLPGCAVTTITRRCGSPTPGVLERPCLWAVKEEQDGDFSAVLIQDHNGYMR